MVSACSPRGARCEVAFWALLCAALFVGTIQQDTSSTVSSTVSPAATTEASTASINSIKTTSEDINPTTTVPSVAPTTTPAVPVNSSHSLTAEPTTVENAVQTLSTEEKVESPNTTLASEPANATTHEMERNSTDSALRFEAQPDMTTTSQFVPPAVTQPATTALTDTSSNSLKSKEMMVMVNCLPKVNAENPHCLQFGEPITCEDFKKTKMNLAETLCHSSQQTSHSGQCHINLSTSDTDPRCLLLSPDFFDQSVNISESTKAALKQHGVELTSSQPSKPRTTLIALVTTGLVVAALILCGYFLSNRQSWSPGSRRLDEDYAGNDSPDNTLISVATRDQSGLGDKSSLKGGTQENGTGQAVTPTTTNGHSNKPQVVADTEL